MKESGPMSIGIGPEMVLGLRAPDLPGASPANRSQG